MFFAFFFYDIIILQSFQVFLLSTYNNWRIAQCERVDISLIMTPFFLDCPPQDNHGGRMTGEIAMMDVTCEAHCIRARLWQRKNFTH